MYKTTRDHKETFAGSITRSAIDGLNFGLEAETPCGTALVLIFACLGVDEVGDAAGLVTSVLPCISKSGLFELPCLVRETRVVKVWSPNSLWP